MNNILAAKVLISHLPEIKDGVYKTATEIAIENLFLDAINDWRKMDTGLSVIEYLELTEEEYNYWVHEKEDKSIEMNSRESEIIERLFYILTELDARESSCNCVISELISKSWDELCDDAIKLFGQLKVRVLGGEE